MMHEAAFFDVAQFQASAAAAARLLRALANERRLLVLCQLAGGEMTVGALHARLGETEPLLSQSALSQHLAILRADGIVAARRERQIIHYSICDPAAAQVMDTLAAIFCPIEPENSDARNVDQPVTS